MSVVAAAGRWKLIAIPRLSRLLSGLADGSPEAFENRTVTSTASASGSLRERRVFGVLQLREKSASQARMPVGVNVPFTTVATGMGRAVARVAAAEDAPDRIHHVPGPIVPRLSESLSGGSSGRLHAPNLSGFDPPLHGPARIWLERTERAGADGRLEAPRNHRIVLLDPLDASSGSPS